MNATLWCVERFKPRAVVMCFGAEAAVYRTDAYPAYHAHRPDMPDDLAHQWALAPDLYRALGWHVVDSSELEADDLMGTLVADEADGGGRALAWNLVTGLHDGFAGSERAVWVDGEPAEPPPVAFAATSAGNTVT